MYKLALDQIENETHRTRLTEARGAYLADRNDDCAAISAEVAADLLRTDPEALTGTRLDRRNRTARFPELGLSLDGVGGPDVRVVSDGRSHTTAEAIYYYEWALEAVILAQETRKR